MLGNFIFIILNNLTADDIEEMPEIARSAGFTDFIYSYDYSPVFQVLAIAGLFVFVMVVLNQVSYSIMKTRIMGNRKWGLNICCGKTDGGGINADIVRHADVPNFMQVKNIYKLPFEDKQFDTVLCSHTIEHVDNPERFFGELKRVGNEVTLILPPLWDISAAFNILEHRHIFLTFKKEHKTLPKYIAMPMANFVHRNMGQRIPA
jgi:hypothetical protein